MGFFKSLTKKVREQAEALQDQSMGMERMPTKSRGGLSSLFGTMSTRRPTGFMPLPIDLTPVDPRPAPVPTGLEALIRPQRTDPGGQEDMRKLMDMQRQTFRSFLAPPPAVVQPQPVFPIDGGDLGLPMEPGTPAPGGVVFEPELGNIDIQTILDNLPRGVGIGGGIGSMPIPDMPYQIPQITDFPIMPLAPQIPIMPSTGVLPMPAMRLPRTRPNTKGLKER